MQGENRDTSMPVDFATGHAHVVNLPTERTTQHIVRSYLADQRTSWTTPTFLRRVSEARYNRVLATHHEYRPVTLVRHNVRRPHPFLCALTRGGKVSAPASG